MWTAPDSSGCCSICSMAVFRIPPRLWLHNRKNRGWRVALEPVVDVKEEHLLLFLCPPDQRSHRIARFRVRVLHLGIRSEARDRVLVNAPATQQCPTDQKVG